MLPDKDTINEIFRIVKALYQSERKKLKDLWTESKTGFSSWRSILNIWIPGSLFILTWGISIINPLLGNLWFLAVIGLLFLALMTISWILGTIITIWKDMRNTLGACPRISIVGSLNPGLVCRLRA
jgi:hypothetical protein